MTVAVLSITLNCPTVIAVMEIGELSRSFSSLLGKLNSYTRFLETVPRMLRHEILNPVNTISMSLQNMASQSGQKKEDSADIATAGKAIEQIAADCFQPDRSGEY